MLPKEIIDVFENHVQNILKEERYRIYNQIDLLRVRKDLPREPERVLNMAKALVLSPELTVQDLFDIMNIRVD